MMLAMTMTARIVPCEEDAYQLVMLMIFWQHVRPCHTLFAALRSFGRIFFGHETGFFAIVFTPAKAAHMQDGQ